MAHAGQLFEGFAPFCATKAYPTAACSLRVVCQARLKLSPNYPRSLKEAELVPRGARKRVYADVSTEEEARERLNKQITVRVCQLHLIS